MTRWARAAGHRFGHREASLLVGGVAWLLYGYNLRTSEPSFAMQQGLTALDHVAGLHVWALLWLVGGAMALFGAVAGFCGWQFRWPRSREHAASWDVVGFVGAVVPPMTWSVAYLLSWWPLNEFERGWNSAGVWGVPACWAMIIASIPKIQRGGPEDGR